MKWDYAQWERVKCGITLLERERVKWDYAQWERVKWDYADWERVKWGVKFSFFVRVLSSTTLT